MAGCVRVLISRTGSPCHTLLCKFRTVKYKIQRRDLSLTSSRHSYDDAFRESIKRPEEFWGAAAEALTWHKKWNKVLDNSNAPLTKWFVGGELSTCYNAVDRHVESGRGEQDAIIHDSPVTKSITRMTYRELQKQVSALAGVLSKHGVAKGDRVLIYMPMIPQAVVAMLATVRLGAIHSLVFGGFASKELSVRINHAQPKVVISANCGVEPGRVVPYKPMLDEALAMSDYQPSTCIIYNRPEFDSAPLKLDRDLGWEEELDSASPVDCVPVDATDPVYLLYTSGTTGLPKAVVRPSGGHAVALNWSMYNIYGVRPGQVWWAASDLGWVVGHSYIAYGPLLHGNTTVIFEGKPVGTPDPGTYFRVIHEHNVVSMFTAPTALRAIRAEVKTGWPITSTCYGLGMNLHPPAGVAGKPVPGWNVKVLNSQGKKTAPGELGEIFVKQPLPPGSLSTLWNADEQFVKTYFSKLDGYYSTMDSGCCDENGYISVLSRSDDVINVAGHRLSAGALEEAILECDDVVEAAVIGVPDKLKGQVPLGLCVIKHEGSSKAIVNVVRQTVGPVAALKQVLIVPKLPKTRSGKIARKSLAAMAAGKVLEIPVTIEDASVYPAIKAALQELGYAKEKL
ncbi:hypothetical protein C0Q70_04809 [Pomacea canaliculata]|uniref:Acyl-CoA synthetase short-chain family member 3, mitochondrial n=1 Tax=Pomacea canaliculata TaxID=400727 RepID=A0A2T7PJI5_POMCA|nr:hypothetical protein C0Q70_04809 [Pomacea canaliculata]